MNVKLDSPPLVKDAEAIGRTIISPSNPPKRNIPLRLLEFPCFVYPSSLPAFLIFSSLWCWVLQPRTIDIPSRYSFNVQSAHSMEICLSVRSSKASSRFPALHQCVLLRKLRCILSTKTLRVVRSLYTPLHLRFYATSSRENSTSLTSSALSCKPSHRN